MDKKILFWLNSGESTTDSSYQAIIDKATALGYTLPSASIRAAQNTLVKSLKAAGIWSRLDLLKVYAMNDASLGNFATLNWITPASYQSTLVNSPTYGVKGYKTDGSTSYLNDNWNPSTNGVNFTLNDHSFGLLDLDGATTEFRMGCATGSNPRLWMNKTSSNILEVLLTRDPGGLYNPTTGPSLYSANRISATQINNFVDTTDKGVAANTPVSIPNLNVFTCAINNSGTPQFAAGTHGNHALTYWGANLASYQTALYNAINTYKTAIGL